MRMVSRDLIPASPGDSSSVAKDHFVVLVNAQGWLSIGGTNCDEISSWRRIIPPR
jgi:hypothetical protein